MNPIIIYVLTTQILISYKYLIGKTRTAYNFLSANTSNNVLKLKQWLYNKLIKEIMEPNIC